MSVIFATTKDLEPIVKKQSELQTDIISVGNAVDATNKRVEVVNEDISENSRAIENLANTQPALKQGAGANSVVQATQSTTPPTAPGLNAIAVGENTHAKHRDAVVLNRNNESGADYQTVVGLNADPDPNAYFIVGAGNNPAGRKNALAVRKDGVVEVLSGIMSSKKTDWVRVALGKNVSAPYYNSAAFGANTKTSAMYQTVFGVNNEDDPDAYFIVGNGGNENARKNAFVVCKDGGLKIHGIHFTAEMLEKLAAMLS